METRDNANTQNTAIQGLLGRYLELRSSESDRSLRTDHLDHDVLSAFAEGNLSEREAKPVISHLVDCSFCRHVSSELVRLDLAFLDAPELPSEATASQPSRVSEVISGILSRIFGTSEAAVFAHEDSEKPEKDKKEEKNQEDSK